VGLTLRSLSSAVPVPDFYMWCSFLLVMLYAVCVVMAYVW